MVQPAKVSLRHTPDKPGPGHELLLTLANWMTAMWPIAVIRPGDLNDSNAAEPPFEAGHWIHRGVGADQRRQLRQRPALPRTQRARAGIGSGVAIGAP